MTEALLPITDGNDALRVAIPRNVVDSAGDDVVLAYLGVDIDQPVERWVECLPPTPLVVPSPTQSQTRTVPDTSPLAT